MQREKYLDSIRGIAILLVIVTHSWHFVSASFSSLFYNLIGEGVRGVQLFFMASALTLFLSFKKSNFTLTSENVRTYAFKRFFRIAPLFYIVMGISFLYYTLGFPLFGFPELRYTITSVSSSLLFVNGFLNSFTTVPLQWSLAVEMLFYVLVPFLFIKIDSLKKATTLYRYYIAVYTVSYIVLMYLLSDHEGIRETLAHYYFFFYCSLLFQFPIFILGIIVYFLLDKKPREVLAVVGNLFIYTLGVLIFYVVTFKALGAGIQMSNISPRIYLETVVFVPMMYYMSRQQITLLSNRFFEFFGKISYSVYLLHMFVYAFCLWSLSYLTNNSLPNKYLTLIYLLISCTILSAIVGTVSQKYIETYFINFGKRFYRGKHEKSVSANH